MKLLPKSHRIPLLALALAGLGMGGLWAQGQAVSSALWPSAPHSESSVPHENGAGGQPLLQIEPPFSRPPHQDPLKKLPLGDSEIRGTLVYTPSLQVGLPAARQYWIFHRFAPGSKQPAALSYQGRAYERVWDPQLSPDGRHLLFKVGDPTLFHNSYELYHWDFAARKLNKILTPAPLNFRTVRWSPDSKKIGYVAGGTREGIADSGYAPVSLNAYDIVTKRNTVIAQSLASIRYNWSAPGKLLYVVSPQQSIEVGEEHPLIFPDCRVFESPVDAPRPQQLLKDVYFAVASPDGRKIAFLGRDTTLKISKAREREFKRRGIFEKPSALFVWDRESRRKTRIGEADTHQLFWSHDSRTLYTLHASYQTVAAKGQGTGLIRAFDIATGRWREVAMLSAHDHQPLLRDEIWPQFEPQLSANGRYLIVKISESTGVTHPDFIDEMKSLVAVDLTTGKITKIAELENKWANVIGWDWHDESEAVR